MLLRAALIDDSPEAATGDIPGPAKRMLMDKWHSDEVEFQYVRTRFPDDVLYWKAAKLQPEIKTLIKAADLIEEIMFLQTEKQLGNRNVGSFDDDRTPLGNSYKRLVAFWQGADMLRRHPAVWDRVMARVVEAENAYSNIIVDKVAMPVTEALQAHPGTAA
jgi:5'-deoxynucleotidase YfbR-like HD superfamily hydrolase